jgi:hypothetical protein
LRRNRHAGKAAVDLAQLSKMASLSWFAKLKRKLLPQLKASSISTDGCHNKWEELAFGNTLRLPHNATYLLYHDDGRVAGKMIRYKIDTPVH